VILTPLKLPEKVILNDLVYILKKVLKKVIKKGITPVDKIQGVYRGFAPSLCEPPPNNYSPMAHKEIK
jgi:hypothetical protein